jgi:hypothetical protein
MARCVTIPMPGGGYAIVRFTGERAPKPCVVCGGIGTKLCDYPRKPKPSRARCNASMCDTHAIHVGTDLDWCEPCAAADAAVA